MVCLWKPQVGSAGVELGTPPSPVRQSGALPMRHAPLSYGATIRYPGEGLEHFLNKKIRADSVSNK